MPTFVGTLDADNIGVEAAGYQVVYGLDGDDVIVGSYVPGAAGSGFDFFVDWTRGMHIEGGDGNDNIAFDLTQYEGWGYGAFGVQFGTYSTFGTVDGGRGDDVISGATEWDVLYGGEGNDTLLGGDGDDRLLGGAGNDTLWGQAGNDRLYGDDGNDVLLGGDGDDRIWGFDGSDYMVGDAGNDLIVFGSYGPGNDSLDWNPESTGQAYGGADDDTIIGAGAYDYMQGDDGNDLLYGYGGNDTLAGGAGIDGLVGGTGSDYLVGGADMDGFYFDDGGVKAGEYDQIADFQDGVDLVFLYSGTQYSLTDTSLGAFLYVSEGGNDWGVFFSGSTVDEVADQILYV